LFANGQFNAVIGFTGDITLPEFVVTELVNIMTYLTVKQEHDVRKVINIENSLKHADRLL